jgi:C-terminal processing protease CtpA/Prc
MYKTLLTIALTILTANGFSQTNLVTTEFNFGLEKTTLNQKLPDNWFQWGSDYLLSIDPTIKHSGNNSVLIQPSEKRASGSFGCLAYSIPARYEGKEIELKAYMKLMDVSESPIGLMLRIDGASGGLQFDNMQRKKIMGTSDWTLYSVKLPFPQGAKTIYIGAILSGTGKLWVDDFELLIDGVSIEKVKQIPQKEYKADLDKEFDNGSEIRSLKLTDQNLKDLKTLGLIWGFLKYYHPEVAEGNFNWDYELFRILPKVLNSNKTSERDAIFIKWIKQLGQFESGEETKTSAKNVKIEPDLDWIRNSDFSEELASLLLNVKNAGRTEEHYYIGLNPSGNPLFKNEKPYPLMKFPDAGYRILALYRYWNIIQYYFPYKYLIEEDWKNVLAEFIPKIIDSNNETEYTLTVLELIAKVHDTHANIWGSNAILDNYKGLNYAGVKLSFVGSNPVVTGFYNNISDKETGLKIGDIISKVNNQPVENIVKEKLKIAPASNYPTQLRDIAQSLLRTNDTVMMIEFIRDNKRDNKTLKAYSSKQLNIYSRPPVSDTCFKLISKDITYINNGSLKKAYLPRIWEEMQNTKGLIIDIRNYPSDFPIYDLSRYLMPKSTPFVKFTNGSIITPGLFTFTDLVNTGNENKNYYRGKVIILINEISQSSAEFHAMAYRVSPNATVIGSTTAGADGNVSQFYLPGGISTMISGIGVYYPDGRETQRVGIVPDVEIKPTIEGIKNGRDELLEKAIQIINGL